ncbi:unnamed protein product, partial [Rotaria sp. Silwood2]
SSSVSGTEDDIERSRFKGGRSISI